jgi:BCD family chlorophyll transporter-like MFS transporter
MDMPERDLTGMVLGAWGAVQATAAGVAMALGGVVRDVASHLAMQGWLGESLISKATGYSVVFHLEIYLLFVVLVALGPLARRRSSTPVPLAPQPFGLAQLPG